ncbi:TetR/AcrR family transcriptional regulator [Thermicanus aegyptius]|uniref:TetR/AcrR family transcriptional regulator n=1 Tax=Thermicanus aegyptius TaxID=94009 RepID=UPI00041FE404|nr:TetR/AcrR family transcriptional regulator [Thermicanus aegyptius]
MKEEIADWLNMMDQEYQKEEKMTEKQLKILHAAIEIFSEKGYASTSTSEIAKKAGVAEGTIFRHYKTKADLLNAIVIPTLVKLLTPFVLLGVRKIFQDPYERFEDFIKAFITDRIKFAKKNEKLLRILIQELPFQSELKKAIKENVGKEVINLLGKMIDHFKKEGQIRDLPTYAIIRHNASVGIGYILTHLYIIPENEWDEEKETEIVIDLLMHGLAPRKEE